MSTTIWSAYGTAKLEAHQKAWNEAKAEAVCTCPAGGTAEGHHDDCPCNPSRMLRRAEQIRREREESCR